MNDETRYLGRIVGANVDPAPKSESKAAHRQRRGRSPHGVRWRMLNTFIDATLRQLDPVAGLTWLILFRDADAAGLARAGQTDLARRAGVSVRTIYSALGKLKSAGLIEIVHKGRIGAGATLYRIRAAAPEGESNRKRASTYNRQDSVAITGSVLPVSHTS
jgi:DNA-binding transcriptional ArsR family regulator